jgi:hypothetical protein
MRTAPQEQRAEVQGGSEQFRTLGNVDHGLGLNRMKREFGGHAQSPTLSTGRTGKGKHLPSEDEDQQRRGQMNRQIRQMERQGGEPRGPVVEGKREFSQRAPAVNRAGNRGCREKIAEVMNIAIELNSAHIVEFEITVHSPGVDRHREQQQPSECRHQSPSWHL